MNIHVALRERGVPLTERVGKAYLSKDPDYGTLVLYHITGTALDMLNAVNLMSTKFRWRKETTSVLMQSIYAILGLDLPKGEFIINRKTVNLKCWLVANDNYANTELWLLLCNEHVYTMIKPHLENLGDF